VGNYSHTYETKCHVLNANMYAQSLNGIFTGEQQIKEIAFMDGYLATPSSGSDIDLTLRYCTSLAQLTAYLEQGKSRFVKLASTCRFRVTLPGAGDFNTSCHIAELLTKALRLGELCTGPLLSSLPSQTPAKMQLVTTQLSSLSLSSLRGYFQLIRNAIGLFHYLLNQVMPRAIYLMDIMNAKSPGFGNLVSCHYTTLRVIGCWVAAAILFQEDDVSNTGIQRLMECSAIFLASPVKLGSMALLLRSSALYEIDLKQADYFETAGESNLLVNSLRKRARERPNAPASSHVYEGHLWANSLIDSTTLARNPITVNAETLRSGEDVLNATCFV